MRLYSELTVNPATITYGQSFSVFNDVGNFGDAAFSGDMCAALFDSEFNFVDFIDTKESVNYPSMTYTSETFSSSGILAAVP